MEEISFEELAEASVLAAPQDPTTHALVQSPFAWDEQE
ncbi:streptamidine-related RiPP repeat protein [Frankia sp. AgPm24]|nr:streptamidine-related RiPP repeat protein [Frankia sp. AgPm24]MCK9921751.1 streptamidine-related RiPP repeat protein [Frankia sp. AgPm24]